MKLHRIPTAVIAVATTLALAACGGGQTSSSGGGGFTAEPAEGGTVHVLQNADFSYLDPARGWDGGVNNFYRLVYRQLTTSAPGSSEDPTKIVPDLAESLGEASDDGLTWTYTLKDGLKFDNGDPITSAEVKFGISRAWDPQIGIGSPYLKQVIDAPKGYEGPYKSGDMPTIETPDDKTIVFHLIKPFPEFDAVLSQVNATPFPVDSGAGNEFIHKIIASGPYKLAEYVPGSTIKLERNENWDPATDEVRAAKPDAWEFTIGLDPATIDERLIAGQGADVNAISGNIQPATLPRLQTPQLKERVLEFPGICTTYMGLNTTKKPLDDVRVRQAISYAIDRTTIVNASGGTQLGDPATTILPPSVAGHKDFDLYPSQDGTGDVEAAKKLLDEAGLADGFTLTLDIRAQESMQAQAEAVQQALERVGITVELNLIDTSTYYETIGTPSQQHDAAITGWCPDWASSAATFLPPLFDGRNIYEKGNGNLAQINDPEINKRIDEIGAMTDIEAANKQWGDLDEQILKLAPVVPLMVAKGVMLPGENVTGLFSSANAATGGIDYVGVGLKDPEKG
ncbi:ABC transporter substrate-binding protein [Promicromonospora sp. NPDC057138]|uniref:ABC transporter substrate-binding protein n=1 Tax=Promicromonospora sp. NPDC057138 TaxID=3346031 RepID=UPI003639FE6F